MANIKMSDLAGNADTLLTAVAVGDYVLVYDISEPLDTNKIKVITVADFIKLVTETGRQALVTSQVAGDLFYASSDTALTRLATGSNHYILKSDGSKPVWSTLRALVAAQALVTSQAAGDLFYASSATALARLAKGTSGKILTQGASSPSWETNPAIASAAAAQATADAAVPKTWIQTGKTLFNLNHNAYVENTITFSPAFSGTPIVTLAQQFVSTYPNGIVGCEIMALSASQMTVRVFTGDEEPGVNIYYIHWIAIYES